MPQFAGTVTIGAVDCVPVSVSEERSIYEKSIACSHFSAKWVRPSFILVIFASGLIAEIL
jgi:hypothetical protein